MRIFIVEDSSTMRKLICAQLSEMGLTDVSCYPDGAAALKAIQAGEKVDCILADWSMPEMTGLDLLKAVRAEPTCAKVPFVMITSESEREKIAMALSCGATNYLLKPFNAQIFREKVLMALEKCAQKST